MTSATRSYGGKTAEQRREERRGALLDAALSLLASGGIDAVTVRRVCTRARLNDRYFAESFADRDDLAAALLTDVAAAGVLAVTQALVGVEPLPGPMARRTVAAGLAFLEEDPRRGAVLVESQATEGLRRARHAVVTSLAATMVAYGTELLGADAPSEKDAELAAFTLVSGVLEILTAWLQGGLDVTREHFADFLVAMILTVTDISAALSRESSEPGLRRG